MEREVTWCGGGTGKVVHHYDERAELFFSFNNAHITTALWLGTENAVNLVSMMQPWQPGSGHHDSWCFQSQYTKHQNTKHQGRNSKTEGTSSPIQRPPFDIQWNI